MAEQQNGKSPLEQEQEKAAERKRKRDEQKAKEARKLEARQQGRIWGKRDLTAGVGEVSEEYFDRIEAFIPMRRLEVSESGEIQDLQSQGVTLIEDPQTGKRNANINVSVAGAGERMARDKAVSYALSVNGETWTVEEVQRLDNVGLVSDIAARAYEISGMTEAAQEDIKSDGDDGGRGDAGVSSDERFPSSADNGAVDAGAAAIHAGGGSQGGSEATGG